MLINILRFLKTLFSFSDVRWDNLRIYIKDSDIDKKAYVNGPTKIINTTVGKGTYIAANAIIVDTTIGKFCSIGPNLLCGWGIHPLNGISTSPVFYSTKKQVGYTYSKTDKVEETKPIHIGNDVFIGSDVVILDGVEIGNGAVIGANITVYKNVPPYAVVVGNPMQIIKYRFTEDIIERLEKSEWWNSSEDVLQKVEENFFDVEGFLNSLKVKDQVNP
jgi:virginiamycin A acetyltransferase